MILHEPRFKPMRLCVALCVVCVACEVHDDIVWNEARAASVERGSAVAPWSDAQVLARTDAAEVEADAAALADVSPDASAGDAALDSGSAFDVAADGIDARCAFGITTLPLGGQYAPKNIGAIWVEHAGGGWVKTLAFWAGVRLRYLTGFRSANPTGNRVDAVTSATLPEHKTHVVGWNLAYAQGTEVPDGEYEIKVEVTDRDAVGQTFAFPFTKRAPPFSNKYSDTQFVTGAELRCR